MIVVYGVELDETSWRLVSASAVDQQWLGGTTIIIVDCFDGGNGMGVIGKVYASVAVLHSFLAMIRGGEVSILLFFLGEGHYVE